MAGFRRCSGLRLPRGLTRVRPVQSTLCECRLEIRIDDPCPLDTPARVDEGLGQGPHLCAGIAGLPLQTAGTCRWGGEIDDDSTPALRLMFVCRSERLATLRRSS